MNYLDDNDKKRNPQAQELTLALEKGKWHGRYGTARCPAHDDKQPSLTIGTGDTGKTVVCCQAGCSQQAVIDALRAQGLWPGDVVPFPPRKPAVQEEAGKTEYAVKIWKETVPAKDTLVQKYLRFARGIELKIPDVLRFHPALMHTPTKTLRPAMVALVTNARGEPMAIHRTYLSTDGASQACVDRVKMMLGPCKGGSIKLFAPGDVLAIGEGIETSLSYSQLTGSPVWAAGSATFLEHVAIPAGVEEAIAIADGDPRGLEKARCAARAWRAGGVPKVRLAKPKTLGTDFNDILLGGVA
jgi:putative DNA primase/helicase